MDNIKNIKYSYLVHEAKVLISALEKRNKDLIKVLAIKENEDILSLSKESFSLNILSKLDFLQIEPGLHLIFEEFSQTISDVKWDALKKCLDRLGENLLKNKHPLLLNPSSDSPKPLFGISESSFSEIYEFGRDLFTDSRIEDALSIFQVLLLLTPQCYPFWISHGLCLQSLQDMETALAYYSIAILLEPKHPQAHLLSTECHIALGNLSRAKTELVKTEKVLSIHNDYQEWTACYQYIQELYRAASK